MLTIVEKIDIDLFEPEGGRSQCRRGRQLHAQQGKELWRTSSNSPCDEKKIHHQQENHECILDPPRSSTDIISYLSLHRLHPHSSSSTRSAVGWLSPSS